MPSNMASGKATVVCPYAIFIPDLQLLFTPYPNAAIKSGLGEMTRGIEIAITVIAKSNNVN